MEQLWERRAIVDEKDMLPFFDLQNGVVWFMQIMLQSGFQVL